MPEPPIDIVPGVYTIPGQPEIMGLCVMLDNQDAQWEITRSDVYGTTIKIKSDSKWNVQEYTDPTTGKRKLQIFREGAKLNALRVINPTQAEGSAYGNAAENDDQKLRIFYTAPEDSDTPPIIVPAR
ncbi:MAG TPA: hypothetical protein VFS27_04945 [Blastocatellia bacterium]|jgi:hypothetical protein|nr:hypothetical protein [Blastocatellia bacterium]